MNIINWIVFFVSIVHHTIADVFDFKTLDLPANHVPYHLNNFPKLKEACLHNDSCLFKGKFSENICWGYEQGCERGKSFSTMECPNDAGWLPSKDEQMQMFYKQADFGYIQEQRSQIKPLCNNEEGFDSLLECSDHLRFCRGRNILVNFTNLAKRKEPIRYAMDVLSSGDIGGHCKLNSQELEKQSDFMSPLQSWAPELRNFVSLDKSAKDLCEINIEIPTIFMKIDATSNMYHHFCDFFNLYAAQHVNLSHPLGFSKDVRILIWESYQYFSNFAPAFFAFTKYPLWNLNTFKGKVVCFKELMFPLLPRMIFGLYYNTPIVSGCEKSGLFRGFREHLLHRLVVPLEKSTKKIRITFLSRNTKYRNVLNEKLLLDALKQDKDYTVNRVVFNKDIMFKKQLEISRNTDIFIGMHGAGLTHLLFLPDWAAVFELYNCGDSNCYKDLARLRGVKYITWEKKELLFPQDEGHHPDSGGAHEKFTNYEFDKNEFLRLIKEAASHVKKHKLKFHKNVASHDEL